MARPRSGRKPRSEISQHLLAVERDAAGGAPAAWKQPQHRAGDRGLAGAGLPDEREALAAAEFKPDIGDDLVRSVGDRQAVDPQQRNRTQRHRRGGLGAREFVGGQSVLRSHRLILFTERTVAIVTKAGAYTSHGHLR